MFCAACGFELLEGSDFCSRCGAQVEKPGAARSDGELERVAALGDREAFGVLYERHSGRVYDFLLRMVGDPDEASDLMQETFLRAMQALSPKEEKASFLTWVLTIARNTALKHLERRKRIVAWAPREGDAEAPAFDRMDPDRLGQPEAAAEAREMASLVWEAAAALDSKQYSLLDLHVRQGLESGEIAQVLRVSKGNAYTMISRLKDSFESAVAGLYMLRHGRRDCPDLDYRLREQSVTVLSPAARKLIANHVSECPNCQERRRKLVSPANILGAFAAVPLPLVVKQQVAETLVASWAQAGRQAPTAGIKGLLSQPSAKLSGLSTTWKAAIISGILVVAAGGGMGLWLAVTGGLRGPGVGETAGSGVPAVATPGPALSAVPVAPTEKAAVGTGRIVFRSNREGSQPPASGVYIMDADGGGVTRIGTQSGWLSYFPDPWSQSSPDGSKVAFLKCPDSASEGLWGAFYVMNADGSRLTTVATNTTRCFTEGSGGGISWSPDSSRVAFFSGGDARGIYVADASGGNVTYLADGIYPQWSPQGDSIAFISIPAPEFQCDIYVIGARGANKRHVVAVPCEGSDILEGPRPQWSSDGSTLLFSTSPEPGLHSPAEPLDREVFTVRVDGSGLTNLTNSRSDDFDPMWVDCRVPTAGCEARVTNIQPDTLNMRQDAGADGEIIGTLSEGDTVCLVGSPTLAGGYKWWPVGTADETVGWVAAFDPKGPSVPWLTPTGNLCGGKPDRGTSGAGLTGGMRSAWMSRVPCARKTPTVICLEWICLSVRMGQSNRTASGLNPDQMGRESL